jgi:hypothetical protein
VDDVLDSAPTCKYLTQVGALAINAASSEGVCMFAYSFIGRKSRPLLNCPIKFKLQIDACKNDIWRTGSKFAANVKD